MTCDVPLDLAALQARCLGKLDLVERVLQTFNEQLDADLEKLEQALAAEDVAMFAQVAHRIKGMSANTEAHQIAREAAIAEQKAREKVIGDLPQHVQRLKADRARFAAAFEVRSRAN
jgi:HPt (histidine-containing phosphotransfer) domain-containing protein